MTVFQDIIDQKIPCDKVFENEEIIAFKDIAPQAPVHLLIVPKKPIKNLQSVHQNDLYLIQEVVLVAQKLAQQFKIQDGYRLVTNNGIKGGQSVEHLHFHLLGGTSLSDNLA